ncbi:ATP-dependent RNA helicase DHX58-like isoform X3 [Dysidea avara]
MIIRYNTDELEKKLRLILQELDEYNTEVKSFINRKSSLETKVTQFKAGPHLSVHGNKDTGNIPVTMSSSLPMNDLSTNNNVALSMTSSTSVVFHPPTSTSPQAIGATSGQAGINIPQQLINHKDLSELRSCYDDIIKNMPDNYSETVQLLERELCDIHISSIFECSHFTAANQIIMECLMEQVNSKEDILDLCERLLQLKNAPQLTRIIENLRMGLQIPETIDNHQLQDQNELLKEQERTHTEQSNHEAISIPKSPEVHKPSFAFVPPMGKKLREYQKELAAPGLDGQNYVVCAPTGTGKTLIASMVISDHLKKNPDGKVFFLVNKIALAEQQCNEVKSYIPGLQAQHITGDCGINSPLSLLLHDNQMIVCTAGILYNEIIMQTLSSTKRVSLNDLSLLVIDECHNAKKNSPYATIMEGYIKTKLGAANFARNLPQIVGLTASPGAGDKPSGEVEKTLDHLLSLCALLDAFGGIKIVRDNITELVNFTNQPDFDLLKTKSRSSSDAFLKQLNLAMDVMEQQLQTFFGLNKCPFPRYMQAYESWVVQQLHDSECRTGPVERDLRTHLKQLQYYYKALTVYQDLTQTDAVALLERKMMVALHPTPHEQSLRLLFSQFCQQAKMIAPIENPKLVRLKQLLVDHFKASPPTRGIIFVTTKESARCMCKWLKENAGLKGLVRPDIVTGRSNKETGGMNVTMQQDIIKQFTEGRLNLLVSTSALEEGLNVPACNLVVRYNYVTNEIARKQAQGRARAKDSRCYAILDESSPKIYQEQLNKEKEDLMMEALEYLPEGEKLKKEITKRQRELLSARELHQQMQKDSKTLQSSQVAVVCRGCDLNLFWGGDLRIIADTHYAVITKDIYERCTRGRHSNSRQTGDFYITQKIRCKRCNQDLGVIIIWPEKGAEFPAIKCQQVMFVTPFGKTGTKQWSKAPFHIQKY